MATKVAAAEFKAKCLSLLSEVNQNRLELIITKRGKPVAKVIPIPSQPAKSAFGWMRGTVEITGDIFSTGAKWEADE